MIERTREGGREIENIRKSESQIELEIESVRERFGG